MKKIKKGDEVVVAIIDGSNAARGVNMSIKNIDRWTCKCEVISSGKKYIIVKPIENATLIYKQIKFNADNYTQFTDYSPDYALYLSKEEVKNERIKNRECNTTFEYIYSKFNSYSKNKFTLDQLRRIKEIIDEKQD